MRPAHCTCIPPEWVEVDSRDRLAICTTHSIYLGTSRAVVREGPWTASHHGTVYHIKFQVRVPLLT